MDEAKKVKIEQLAATAHDKRVRYDAMGMMNTPDNAAERTKAAIAYALCKGELYEANRALEDALNA